MDGGISRRPIPARKLFRRYILFHDKRHPLEMGKAEVSALLTYLRVKDLDFVRMQISVHETKGKQDRLTMLPRSVVAPLQEHLKEVRAAHERAMREGYGGVELPCARAGKYPKAPYAGGGQYVFPRRSLRWIPAAACDSGTTSTRRASAAR